MTTFPLATLAPTISATGISAPPFADILASLQASYRGIYGSDAYLEPDSQDGQWIAVIASAVNDTNSAIIADYNARSPSTAQGAGLSSIVKINGIRRDVPTNSTALVTIVGQAYTPITNGKVTDALRIAWALPALVTIPSGGSIDVTATCAVQGAIAAAAGTIITIATPTLGWQSVTNAAGATVGAPVETDAALRRRQTASTALSATSALKAIIGAVETLTGVTQLAAYENDTDAADANGLPEHSICMVTQGGDSTAIATAILLAKTGGGGTFGSTTVTVPDAFGIGRAVNFTRPTLVGISVEVSLHALAGYTTAIGAEIQAAVAAYINAFLIGDDTLTTRLYLPAMLFGAADAATFELTLIRIKKTAGGSFATTDIAIAYNELAFSTVGAVTILVV